MRSFFLKIAIDCLLSRSGWSAEDWNPTEAFSRVIPFDNGGACGGKKTGDSMEHANVMLVLTGDGVGIAFSIAA